MVPSAQIQWSYWCLCVAGTTNRSFCQCFANYLGVAI